MSFLSNHIPHARCDCGSPARWLLAPESAYCIPVPLCMECAHLLLQRITEFDKTLFCDLYHTTWLAYDFHPHPHG